MSKKLSSQTAAHTIKNRWSALLSILLCAGTFVSATLAASAASAAEKDDDGARWFEVEIILFAHNDPQAQDAEHWPDIEGIELPLEDLLELRLPSDPEAEPADQARTEKVTPDIATDMVDETLPAAPVAFQLLDKSEWRLAKTARRLQRSSRFKPLLHIAWRQPTYELARARPVLIYSGMDEPLVTEDITHTGATEADSHTGPPNPRLVGTIKLSVARYLHLATDLIYRIPVTQQTAERVPDFDLWYDRPYPTLYEPQGPAYRLEEWQAMRGFRMQESRRMRSKVVHYLDHPFFGMVVLITPVELPKPEEKKTDSTTAQ